MLRLFLECAIRAALIVAGAAIVLYAMRVKAAAVKHRVWTAVILVMLALPAWTAWGPKAPLRILPASMESSVSEVLSPPVAFPLVIARPSTANVEIPELRRPAVPTWQALLLGVYLLGILFFSLRLTIGTLKAHTLVRQSALHEHRRTSIFCAAPVTVGWFQPTVILPEYWRQWPKAQLDAVLAHEEEHARRRDPLVQWLALLNRAVFWFHPVAWWLERKLSILAEEACDSAVLARGYDPRDYAETLMEMARSVMRSGARVSVVGMAMPGGHVSQRVRRIIEGGRTPRISRTRLGFLAGVCAITCTIFAAGLPQAIAPPAFEVASVKPSQCSDGRVVVDYDPTAGRANMRCVPLRGLIMAAFGVEAYAFSGPKQLDQPRYAIFDIEAKAAGPTPLPQLLLMTQTLLKERFKLAVHWQTKELPVYLLVVAKNGPKLEKAEPPGPEEPNGTHGPNGQLIGTKTTMNRMATVLTGRLGRPVLDRTGLTGFYNFVMTYTPDQNLGGTGSTGGNTAATTDSTSPSILTALQEQLGLKLETQTAPVKVLVVEHVEEASPN